jgi:hypothetical protein
MNEQKKWMKKRHGRTNTFRAGFQLSVEQLKE